jgi:hypothetical protein
MLHTPLDMPPGTFQTIDFSVIAIDARLQVRNKTDLDTIADYRRAIKNGEKLPPLTVFYDGTQHWLVDGVHRLKAYGSLGSYQAECLVIPGDFYAAFQWTLKNANIKNGLRLSKRDKTRKLELALADPVLSQLDDPAIAEALSVSEEFVSKNRKSLGLTPYTESEDFATEPDPEISEILTDTESYFYSEEDTYQLGNIKLTRIEPTETFDFTINFCREGLVQSETFPRVDIVLDPWDVPSCLHAGYSDQEYSGTAIFWHQNQGITAFFYTGESISIRDARIPNIGALINLIITKYTSARDSIRINHPSDPLENLPKDYRKYTVFSDVPEFFELSVRNHRKQI